MKIGDIVQRKYGGWNAASTKGQTGIVIKIFEKKCWRTHELGSKVNWDLIDPELHCSVLIGERVSDIPMTDLERV